MQRQCETFDVIVCGGGLAGICAAVAAARNGANTCIIQDRPVFGGNSSSEIRVIPQGAANYNAYARETGIISELLIEERAVNHEPNHKNGRANSVWDMVLYNKVVSTPGLRFHVNTSVQAVQMGSDGKIKTIEARVANAETILELTAKVFVDCTGDGILADLAGCEWRMGSEGQEEFGEPHAPPKASEEVMGSSIHFRSKDMGRPVPYKAPAWAYSYTDPDVFYKGGRNPNDPEGGFWWIELSVPWNIISDNEIIRHELTRHVLGIWDYMKNTDPDLKHRTANYAIDWIGQVPGKRESRRIMGQYLLTERDILHQTAFEDEIAYGGWYIDLHNCGGLLAAYSEQSVVDGHESAYMNRSYIAPYGIPLRCLQSKDVSNLLLAGRNISVTHVALGSARVMGTTALLGQAAGTAAAIAIERKEEAGALSVETIRALKQQLIKEDCFLLHTVNEDALDLARNARISASSEAMLGRLEPTSCEHSCEEGSFPDTVEALSAMRGQWVAVSSNDLTAVSVCISNRTDRVMQLDAALTAVQHIWDYRTSGAPELARAKLAVPPGARQWLRWELNLSLEGLESGYVRLELGPNPALGWHKAAHIAPGMAAAYDMGNGRMRRVGDGETLAFSIEPQQASYAALNMISGVTRPYRHTNLWRSDPAQAMPQWIEQMWEEEQTITEVNVTFAGHLFRDYRFYPAMHHDPQCVKDYELQAMIEGRWVVLASVRDNYDRRRTHRLPESIRTTKLRLMVLETNGDPSAAVYEIRVY